ncbi:MAG TPA: hypothetical protein VGS57_13690 [Thermoanaerobaculia bacterium]|jgi:hypothetical protein|nr:hypothetical protein [Thermoanaerobaculia bacterium]
MHFSRTLRTLLSRCCWIVALLLVVAGGPAHAAGLTASGSQLFYETSANPLHPPAMGDQLGFAVATGDFDGDGADDLAIGLRSDDTPIGPIADVGQVQIRWGAAGTGLQAQGATVKYLWQGGTSSVDDPEAGDHFGESLAAGDFDHDGFDDLAIGIPGEDVGTISNAGAVEVRYGAANRGAALETRRQLFHENTTGMPDNSGIDDEFGHALATGDFDADTFDDLVIGVPLETANATTDGGRVFVLYGTPSGLDVARVQTFEDGVETPDHFGEALAAADFDNDGRSDLAVGAPGYASGAGLVHILYDLPGLPSTLTFSNHDSFWQQNLPDSSEPGDHFSAALAAGNFDGDDFADLAVGVPDEDVDLTPSIHAQDAGAVHVLFGSAVGLATGRNQFWTANSTAVPGEAEAGDRFGFTLAAGDFNNDGFDELVIAVPFEENFRGPEEGDVVVLPSSQTGPDGAGARTWNLEVPGILGDMNPGDHLGWSLAVGDFDHNGADDLTIGIPNDGNIGGVLALYGTLANPIFSDGFESGSTLAWSAHWP